MRWRIVAGARAGVLRATQHSSSTGRRYWGSGRAGLPTVSAERAPRSAVSVATGRELVDRRRGGDGRAIQARNEDALFSWAEHRAAPLPRPTRHQLVPRPACTPPRA